MQVVQDEAKGDVRLGERMGEEDKKAEVEIEWQCGVDGAAIRV